MVSEAEVLQYAREVKVQRPTILQDELRAVLRARFIDGEDSSSTDRSHSGMGSINNPYDWLNGLAKIFSGIAKLWTKKDPRGIGEIIDGVVVIVSEESDQ